MVGTTVQVAIHDLAHGGEGVGKIVDVELDEPRVCFIAGALPGEQVRAKIDREHKRWLRGHSLEVLEPTAQRVTPPCALADRCGGCSWQHVDAAAQAGLKAGIVENQLRRLPVPSPTLAPSPRALAYRRRARMHYQVERAGKGAPSLALGFFGQRSHEVVDAPSCAVLDPALDWALQQLRAWAR